jgi:anti-sigma B factor antagonist
MKYSVDKQEKYTVFTLHEENLNSLLAPALKTEFKVLHEEGTPNLVLDLSDLKYVDSSGLSAILTAKRLWGDEGSFVLTGINNGSNVKKLIEISKLDSVLTIIPTVDESIDYIFMEEIERELNEDDEDDD